ncbi:MAG TPA: hypothetical protein VM912_05840 [Terriglobales bacterium]|nr:hypothetical protein [Terriglobales bacterium]
MSRGLLAIGLGLILLASPGFGQRMLGQHARGPELRGIPGSVTDPRPDGSLRGIPGSVTDPRSTTGSGFRGSFGFGNGGHFGAPRHHRGTPVVGVPYYVYPYAYDSSYYDQSPDQPAPPQPAPQVIVIKEEPSHSEDSSRYGEHSFDGSKSQPVQQEAAQPKPPAAQPTEDLGPTTTLVYRDGHKSEIRNYAIVGSNLFDLTKSPAMKKIPLASLDLEATRRENEENGVDFHLP